MLNVHVYEPDELSSIDRRALASLELDLEDASCIVYMTRVSDPRPVLWFINPAWRCVARGHWFVYYHA